MTGTCTADYFLLVFRLRYGPYEYIGPYAYVPTHMSMYPYGSIVRVWSGSFRWSRSLLTYSFSFTNCLAGGWVGRWCWALPVPGRPTTLEYGRAGACCGR